MERNGFYAVLPVRLDPANPATDSFHCWGHLNGTPAYIAFGMALGPLPNYNIKVGQASTITATFKDLTFDQALAALERNATPGIVVERQGRNINVRLQ